MADPEITVLQDILKALGVKGTALSFQSTMDGWCIDYSPIDAIGDHDHDYCFISGKHMHFHTDALVPGIDPAGEPHLEARIILNWLTHSPPAHWERPVIQGLLEYVYINRGPTGIHDRARRHLVDQVPDQVVDQLVAMCILMPTGAMSGECAVYNLTSRGAEVIRHQGAEVVAYFIVEAVQASRDIDWVRLLSSHGHNTVRPSALEAPRVWPPIDKLHAIEPERDDANPASEEE